MRRLLCCVLLLLAGFAARADDYRVEVVAEGLEHPWSLAFLPDGRMLVTERAGRLRVIGADGALSAPIEGVPAVHAESQGGLFDVLPARDFADSGRIYLSYADGPPGANATALLRATLVELALVEPELLFRAEPAKDTPVHYGGRMCWMADGTLLLGLGDDTAWHEQGRSRFPYLGQFINEPAIAKQKELTSAALGFNELHEILCAGRCTLDVMLYVKTNYQRSRYTLDAIAAEFVGEQKHEITHADIYQYYEQGPEQRAAYSAQLDAYTGS